MIQQLPKVRFVYKSGDSESFAKITSALHDFADPNARYALVFCDNVLGLCHDAMKEGSMVAVDLSAPSLSYRLKKGGCFKEDLVKAVGASGRFLPKILDASAGLGKDALVLANVGCHVSLLERNPLVWQLLANGIERAFNNEKLALLLERITLLPCNAWDRLEAQSFDVAYFDPMFPHRLKSALVKKEMQLFQQIVGSDEDSGTFLMPLLRLSKKRVVVKRPHSAPFLANLKPSFSRMMKNHRFDIYLSNQYSP